jgi:hypothetical protein
MGKCIECANNTLLKIMGRKALCFQGDQIGRLCPNGAFFIFAQFHENWTKSSLKKFCSLKKLCNELGKFWYGLRFFTEASGHPVCLLACRCQCLSFWIHTQPLLDKFVFLILILQWLCFEIIFSIKMKSFTWTYVHNSFEANLIKVLCM